MKINDKTLKRIHGEETDRIIAECRADAGHSFESVPASMQGLIERLRRGWDGVDWTCDPACDLIGYGVHHANCLPTYTAADALAVSERRRAELKDSLEAEREFIQRFTAAAEQTEAEVERLHKEWELWERTAEQEATELRERVLAVVERHRPFDLDSMSGSQYTAAMELDDILDEVVAAVPRPSQS